MEVMPGENIGLKLCFGPVFTASSQACLLHCNFREHCRSAWRGDNEAAQPLEGGAPSLGDQPSSMAGALWPHQQGPKGRGQNPDQEPANAIGFSGKKSS